MLKQLKKEAADIFIENLDFTEVKEDQLKTDLLHMEDRLFIKAYRMGVVYCAEGQADEMDMFSNGTWNARDVLIWSLTNFYFPESGSDAFNNFLDFLGEKVKLKGYKGYNGGLDVHGKSSISSHNFYLAQSPIESESCNPFVNMRRTMLCNDSRRFNR